MPGPLGFWGLWGAGTRGPAASPRFNSVNRSIDTVVIGSIIYGGNFTSTGNSSENNVAVLDGSILSGTVDSGAIMPAAFTSTDASVDYQDQTSAYFLSIDTSSEITVGGVLAATTFTSTNTSTEIVNSGATMPGVYTSQGISYDAVDSVVVLSNLTQNEDPESYGGENQTILAPVAVWVIDPNDVEIALYEPHYEAQLNKGVTWQCKTAAFIPNGTYTAEGIWTLYVETRQGVWQSPPLALKIIQRVLGDVTETHLAGIDYTTYRLGTEGFVTVTFFNQTAAYILQWIGRFAGVEVVFTEDPFLYQIEEYSIHGGTLLSHFSQILHDFGGAWMVGPSGEIKVFPSNYTFVVNRPYTTHNYTDSINLEALITYLRLVKHSKTTDTSVLIARTPGIQGPTNIGPFDPTSIHISFVNTVGSFVYAGLYDSQSPPQLCYFNNSSNGTIPNGVEDTPTSTNPAVSCIWDVAEPPPGSPLADLSVLVKLIISGRPPNAGGNYQYRFQIDFPLVVPTFYPTELVIGGVISPTTPGQGPVVMVNSVYPVLSAVTSNVMIDVRLKTYTFESSLWPNTSVVYEILSRLWEDVQRGAFTWRREMTELDPNPVVGENILPEVTGNVTIPASRVDLVSWAVDADGGASMTLAGYYPVPFPTGGSFAPFLVSLGNDILIPGG